ncbi:MAG: hypothetical protein LBB89_12395 [Treponema sp.]|nr:hypothetical protein [Treponema sp.]
MTDEEMKAHEKYMETFYIPLEIPLGFALKAVPRHPKTGCQKCYYAKKGTGDCPDEFLPCKPHERKDGQNVMFQLVRLADG